MSKVFSRRAFLSGGLKLTASACCSAAFGSLGPKMVFAQSPQGSGKTLVLINFFGGIDGLNWIVPYTNQVYYDRRPNIAIRPENVLQINNQLGFHPAFAPLYNTVGQQGKIAVIQQVGYPEPSHSHFTSQDIWSYGKRTTNRNDERGWIGRLSDLYFDSNYDVIGIGVSQQPDFNSNRPDARPILVNNLRDVGFSEDYGWWHAGRDNTYRVDIAEANAFSGGPLGGFAGKIQESSKKIFTTSRQLKQIDSDYTSVVAYPNSSLGFNLREVAKVMQSNIGTQVFYTGVGGWDTHSNQTSSMQTNLGQVAAAVNSFILDLKNMNKFDDVCIVFFSEFGRNTYENGTRGTDHGHGNSMTVIGGGVQGGVYGSVPSAQDLLKEDLGYYIDFRSVFKTVIRSHLGLDPNPVFDEPVPIAEPGLNLFI